MPTDSRRVACPECGQEFSPRGLAGHRRQRHGAGVQAPLPAPISPSVAHQLLSALQLLGGAVADIESRMRAMESAASRREAPADELGRLERELAAVLEDIACVQRLAAVAGAAASGPHADELARLRREQALRVFRIDELKQGAPNAERFLI
jgi:hypothetical protein